MFSLYIPEDSIRSIDIDRSVLLDRNKSGIRGKASNEGTGPEFLLHN